MKQRGRMSASALSVIANVQHLPRPEPPAELSDEEAAVWRGYTQSLPADWIKPYAQPILIELCSLVVESRRIRQLISEATADPDMSIASYDRLLKAHGRLARDISSLSVKLRFTPSSEYRKEDKKEVIGDRAWSVRKPSRNSDTVD